TWLVSCAGVTSHTRSPAATMAAVAAAPRAPGVDRRSHTRNCCNGVISRSASRSTSRELTRIRAGAHAVDIACQEETAGDAALDGGAVSGEVGRSVAIEPRQHLGREGRGRAAQA